MKSESDMDGIYGLDDSEDDDMPMSDDKVTPAMPMSFSGTANSVDGLFTTPVVGAAKTPFGAPMQLEDDSAPLMLATANGDAKTQGGIIQEDESYSSSEIDDM